jgi:O-acetyl-ADP-ribose deacetylase (regulator of RNase III)
MKIEYIKGDLFSTECKTILHGCNAQGVMGSGVAKIIREKYPKAYNVYVEKHNREGLRLGHCIKVLAEEKLIVNAITQQYYGRDGSKYVSYDAVDEVMKEVNTMHYIYGIKEIAMPQIGAGLGGGNWRVIEAIIESRLTLVQPLVYIL